MIASSICSSRVFPAELAQFPDRRSPIADHFASAKFAVAVPHTNALQRDVSTLGTLCGIGCSKDRPIDPCSSHVVPTPSP
jgi:hypothetical protein